MRIPESGAHGTLASAGNTSLSKERYLKAVLDAIFVAFPMLILGIQWPDEGHAASSIFDTPELATAAMVLFGLSLSTLCEICMIRARQNHAILLFGYVVWIVVLLLLTGVSIAVINNAFMHARFHLAQQIFLFFLAILGYALVVRHRVRRCGD